ncbi:hypothetical protein QO010_003012 [Caulobacter ginsengisoli]|uniref:HNH endonuclease n=1 Tax=Caulobacter ginsengisoli TaxID=400775 RepID=A0ABU0IV16_9CAUL|nr:hypothetical protein [Caulobacter ginsengisoli]MDQ0465225.1 hypothetical protein [Caulobacter ginsengisoli]
MRQVTDFSDERNKGWCVHCGGPYETDDHMPSKVFLDRPFPENLPVTPACASCNEGFSRDEEYLACLLECILAGSAHPDDVERSAIARKLRDQPGLRKRLEAARRSEGDGVLWDVEVERVNNVVVKLARGHVAFESGEPRLDEPAGRGFQPLLAMSPAVRRDFEHVPDLPQIWPEVGSRAMSRLFVTGVDVFDEGWQEVQSRRYRYRVDGAHVRMVIRDYLAAEVWWD